MPPFRLTPEQYLCAQFRAFAVQAGLWPKRRVTQQLAERWELVKNPSWGEKVALELHGNAHWLAHKSFEELAGIFVQAAARKSVVWMPPSQAEARNASGAVARSSQLIQPISPKRV